MIPVLRTDSTFRPVGAGSIIDSLDGETRAPLETILAESWSPQEREEFGIYQVDITPPEGQRWTGEFALAAGHPVAVFGDLPPPSTDPADYPLLPWQFKAMVDYQGKDQAIRDAIALIEDPLIRAASMSRYLNASSYEFNDPLMQSARAAVGMSVEDLTAAWMMAKDLRSS